MRVHSPNTVGEAVAVKSAAPQHPYERKIVLHSDNLLIESRCALCGFHIVGSAAGTLVQEEEDHAERCPKKMSKAVAADIPADPAG